MIETNFFLAISSFVSLGIGVVAFVWAIVITQKTGRTK